jgi:hypothetical protein
MVKRAKTNSDLDVKNVIRPISGKKKRINIIVRSTGSSYGLTKVILYGNYVSFLAIVNQNYIE